MCNLTHTPSVSGTQLATHKSAGINEGLLVLKAIISDCILRPVEISDV
jgi:hypothetical protein